MDLEDQGGQGSGLQPRNLGPQPKDPKVSRNPSPMGPYPFVNQEGRMVLDGHQVTRTNDRRLVDTNGRALCILCVDNCNTMCYNGSANQK